MTMPGIAAAALLFVAAALLVLAAVGLRRRGGEPPAGLRLTMAAMFGIAIGFLMLVLSIAPLVIFPLWIGAILVLYWSRRRQWSDLGAFLTGLGGLWSVAQASYLLNDVTDPAVTYPGWTPIPLATAVAATIVGITLLASSRLRRA